MQMQMQTVSSGDNLLVISKPIFCKKKKKKKTNISKCRLLKLLPSILGTIVQQVNG